MANRESQLTTILQGSRYEALGSRVLLSYQASVPYLTRAWPCDVQVLHFVFKLAEFVLRTFAYFMELPAQRFVVEFRFFIFCYIIINKSVLISTIISTINDRGINIWMIRPDYHQTATVISLNNRSVPKAQPFYEYFTFLYFISIFNFEHFLFQISYRF